MKHQPFEFGTFFHIFNRGNNHENIFNEPDNYYYFLSLAVKYINEVAEIYSYCLLPNHFHFALRIKDLKDQTESVRVGKKGIHQAFSNCFNAYAKAFNKKYSRKGSLFQEHLKRVLIKEEHYLQNIIIYINTNPLHHGLANYTDYDYSSYKSLVTTKSTHIKREEVLDMFGGLENFIYILNNKKQNIDIRDSLLLE